MTSANKHREENQNDNEKAEEQVNETASETAAAEPSEIDILREENARFKDQALRALAEAENARRRAKIDVEEASKYSVTGFARDLINVLENLVRAEENIPADQAAVKEGVALTKNELVKAFEKHGIKRVEPQAGDDFNHETQQAVMQINHAEVEAGKVVQLLQAGYVIKDRLLRPAMVSVSKGPETDTEGEAE